MKKTTTLLVLMAMFALGCKSEENKIKSVAEEFLTAYYVNYDYSKAEELATMESRLTISNKKESVETNYFAEEEKARSIIIQKVSQISENYATVEYSANDMSRRLVLVRKDKDGKWKVDTIESGIDGSSLAPNAKSGFTSSQSDATPI